MNQSDLEGALMNEAHLGRKVTLELALLNRFPEPPKDEGSRKRMVMLALHEGLLETWPDNIQNQWFARLQEELFGFQSES